MKLLIKILLMLLAFVPLVVDQSAFYPFVDGKSLLIRVVISLVALLFFSYFLYSKSFRQEIYLKVQNIYKNPIFLSLIIFFVVLLLSTLFAVDIFRAFFGDIERAEGFLGISFFFGFLIFSLLLFEKKDWLTFFKLSFVLAIIMFIDGLVEVFGEGLSRAESTTGNPIYLAVFFLFSLFAALIVLNNAVNEKKKFWIWTSSFMSLISLLGILIANSRGVFLGIAAAIFVVFLYLLVRGKGIFLGRIGLKKLGAIGLILTILLIVGFLSTKNLSFWQKVPLLGRVAQISLEDPSTRSRLINYGISFDAINPKNESVGRFLTGWGPENYGIAWQKYYNPEMYTYTPKWFDRSHNKLLDVLVMNGILGLLAYLAIWISFFWLVLKSRYRIQDTRYRILERSSLLFFGVSYFVQNLFVFDTIVTYIPFFLVMAYVIYHKTGIKI